MERYLRECIDSVLGQTYENLEIILIDDGSTDKSGVICDKYALKDARVKVFHTRNNGLSSARNLGIAHSTGAYIGFVDSDDWIELSTIEEMLNSIKSVDADIAVCGHYLEYGNGVQFESTPVLDGNYQGDSIIYAFLKGCGVDTYVWNKLYRSELFKNIKFPDGRFHEDDAVTYKLLEASDKMIGIPKRLIHYRMRKNSIAHSHSLNNLIDYWTFCHEKYNALKDRYEDCRIELISESINAIGRFWRWLYPNLSNNSNILHDVVPEMQSFVRKHTREVMCSKKYSREVCFYCCMAHFSNPFVFWVLYYATQFYRFFHRISFYD